MIDKRPAAVVRCRGTADVAAVIGLARGRVSISRCAGGAHSAPGFGTNDGGLVVDLSPLHDVVVAPDTQTAACGRRLYLGRLQRRDARARLGDDGRHHRFDGDRRPTLGGGIGYLSRKYGLSCDNLVSAEVVTADGQVLTASERDNSDLFWALRGGGGNFGVVTTFEYQLHPVAEIYGGPIAYPADRIDDVLRFFREYIDEAPEELGGFIGFHLAPPLPFLPEEWHFKNVCLAVLSGPARSSRARRWSSRSLTSSNPSGHTSARCRIRRSTRRSTRCSRPASSTTGSRASPAR